MLSQPAECNEGGRYWASPAFIIDIDRGTIALTKKLLENVIMFVASGSSRASKVRYKVHALLCLGLEDADAVVSGLMLHSQSVDCFGSLCNSSRMRSRGVKLVVASIADEVLAAMIVRPGE